LLRYARNDGNSQKNNFLSLRDFRSENRGNPFE
jgi:hypothetical protein